MLSMNEFETSYFNAKILS